MNVKNYQFTRTARHIRTNHNIMFCNEKLLISKIPAGPFSCKMQLRQGLGGTDFRLDTQGALCHFFSLKGKSLSTTPRFHLTTVTWTFTSTRCPSSGDMVSPVRSLPLQREGQAIGMTGATGTRMTQIHSDLKWQSCP